MKMKVMITNFFLQPKNLEELIMCVRQASLLEVNTPGKPGNVNPEQNIKNLNITDFHLAISAIADELHKYFIEWNAVFQEPFTSKVAQKSPYSLGHLIYRLCNAMIKAQSKGNILLGHILLFSPLIFAASELISHPLKKRNLSWDSFWILTEKILHDATVEDSIWLYRAIKLVQPGGLKNPGGEHLEFEYDFTSPNVEQKIIDNQRTFLQLFHESSSFDTISQEMLSTYAICREFFLSNLYPRKKSNEISVENIQHIYLSLLAKYPDSLIYRKTNKSTSIAIQNEAKDINIILDKNLQEKREKVEKLNRKLILDELNPGTTADLTACVILLGLFFKK